MPKSRKRKNKLKKKKSENKKETDWSIPEILTRQLWKFPSVLIDIIYKYNIIPPFYMYCFGAASSMLFRETDCSQFPYNHGDHYGWSHGSHGNSLVLYGVGFVDDQAGAILAKFNSSVLTINPIFGPPTYTQDLKTRSMQSISYTGMTSFDESGIYYGFGYVGEIGLPRLSIYLYQHDIKDGYSKMISNCDECKDDIKHNFENDTTQVLIASCGKIFNWCKAGFNQVFDIQKREWTKISTAPKLLMRDLKHFIVKHEIWFLSNVHKNAMIYDTCLDKWSVREINYRPEWEYIQGVYFNHWTEEVFMYVCIKGYCTSLFKSTMTNSPTWEKVCSGTLMINPIFCQPMIR